MERFSKEGAVWVEWQEVKNKWWLPRYRIVSSVAATLVLNVLSVIPVIVC